MARPSKFTSERRERFLDKARDGLHPSLCRRAAGWSESLMYAYFARGRDARDHEDAGQELTAEQESYLEFLEAVEKAEVDWAARQIRCVNDAAPESWQAAMTNLERRFPEYRRAMAVTGEDGGPIAVEVTAEGILRSLRELAAGPGSVQQNGGVSLHSVRELPRSVNGNGDSAPEAED